MEKFQWPTTFTYTETENTQKQQSKEAEETKKEAEERRKQNRSNTLHYRKTALPRRPPSAYFELCRQPRPGRWRILAVGLPRAKPTAPVGIHMSSAQLRTWRQQPSAYPGRRHTRGPGDPARDQRLTSSNLCRRPGRAAVGIPPRQRSTARRPPPKTWPSLCRRHSRRHR